MCDTRIGVGICLAAGALALAAPAAAAADPTGDQTLRISPANAAPGTRITVTTRACGKETYGKGTSEAAGAFHLLEGDSAGELVGTFDLPEDTGRSSDTVTVKCPPRNKFTDTYRIADGPRGGVDAGFGAPTDHSTQLAVGSVLLAGAAAGGVVRLRRRPADRG
ncbi:sortase [uncultured Streptomyces sp.]|uniref:sortase n=1 Tax=uncultured Streptomyces sp. TaxID=174707 RepID=UPI00260C880F|nr:sortase [uncultured Streptomyces sp.]